MSETTTIKDAAVSETTTIKDAAAASAAQASNSATEAGQQASNAASSAQSAAADAGRAEAAVGKAGQVISQAVLKDQNLSDLSNIEIARQNMRIGPFDTVGEHTIIYSPDRSYRLVIRDDGLLVHQNVDGFTTKPFQIYSGGTGATDAAGARSNLGLGTAALKNTGVSGDAVPLLNADNTWSGVQTLSTPLAVASGGTGVSSLAALFTALNIFGRVVGVTQLISSGTWRPSATAKAAFVFLQAGGGAGGGSAAPEPDTSSAGSGGNSGSGALIYIPSLAASYNCVVGSGGASVAGSIGGSGGDTSFGNLCSVVGGGGGSVLTSGGNTAVGPAGQREDYTEPTLFRTGPGFGTAVFVFGTSGRQAGHGADSSLGRGGRSGAVGRDGGGFGSGGGGAESAPGSPARPGGNGAGGCILIIELS